VLELEGVRKAYGTNVVLDKVGLHIERGDRIALVAPNGAGKSTLMRLLAGDEPPDAGARREGHQVVMQYFAQDEANRLDPVKTVYQTMEGDSPVGMVPMIRNILGGFLFSGDDIYKKAGVLSGGERTRLAVARMLLRPANTLLLDEPTNHLDLDSKDVLLEALADFGGTLIFVSHDRYFVDKLATKIVAVGHGSLEVYPGTYEQFLWSRHERAERGQTGVRPGSDRGQTPAKPAAAPATPPKRAAAVPVQKPTPQAKPVGTPTKVSESRPAATTGTAAAYAEKKRVDAEARRRQRAADERAKRVAELEGRIAEREQEVRALEAKMAEPGFYNERESAESLVIRHQQLMWEVGDLMNQWESLAESDDPDTPSR
jgi:ATP-binding cassette subfamily F protein 3